MTASELYREIMNDNVSLIRAQPRPSLPGRMAGEVGHWWAAHQYRVDRGQDPALAQRPDDPTHVAGGQQLFRRLKQ